MQKQNADTPKSEKAASILMFGLLSKHIAGARPLKTWERRSIMASLIISGLSAQYWMIKAITQNIENLEAHTELIGAENREKYLLRRVREEARSADHWLNTYLGTKKQPDFPYLGDDVTELNLGPDDFDHPTVAEGTTPADYT